MLSPRAASRAGRDPVRVEVGVGLLGGAWGGEGRGGCPEVCPSSRSRAKRPPSVVLLAGAPSLPFSECRRPPLSVYVPRYFSPLTSALSVKRDAAFNLWSTGIY